MLPAKPFPSKPFSSKPLTSESSTRESDEAFDVREAVASDLEREFAAHLRAVEELYETFMADIAAAGRHRRPADVPAPRHPVTEQIAVVGRPPVRHGAAAA